MRNVLFVLSSRRRKHCIICQKKLVLNMSICYMCQYVGATPPDPQLLEALESKSIAIQGIPPERFPGSTIVVALIRRAYAYSVGVIYSCFKPSSSRKYAREVVVLPVSGLELKPTADTG
jgi:hypothetical protein